MWDRHDSGINFHAEQILSLFTERSQFGFSTHEATLGLVDFYLDLATSAFACDFRNVKAWYYSNVAKSAPNPVRNSHKSGVYVVKAGIPVFERNVGHIYIDRQAVQILYKQIYGSPTMYCKAFLVGNKRKYPQKKFYFTSVYIIHILQVL